tara:strand:+ start:107 stop:958 length:852 start_codon:yes stop_codon:yes gene_type:complete
MKLSYLINNQKVEVEAPQKTHFFRGDEICLSQRFQDLTSSVDWYSEGYKIIDFSKILDFHKIKECITYSTKKTIEKQLPNLSLENFTLANYHKFISPSDHLIIDKSLKRLYPKDFGFDDKKIIELIEDILSKPLSYKQAGEGKPHWIIVRINMPKSTGLKGFNPVHKDIYESYDHFGTVPKMVNAWIPICGVNDKTGLPLVPGSHLLKESQIIRTKAGSTLEGQNYSVNCIKSWNNQCSMKLISPQKGSLILFSSHLIHGLGHNNNQNSTRVSLEFRLHLKEK